MQTTSHTHTHTTHTHIHIHTHSKTHTQKHNIHTASYKHIIHNYAWCNKHTKTNLLIFGFFYGIFGI